MVDPYFSIIFDYHWAKMSDPHKSFFADNYIPLMQSALATAACQTTCEAVVNQIESLEAWIVIATPYITPPVIPDPGGGS